MPYVNIRLLEGVSAEDKAKLIDGATQLLVDVLGKDPTHLVVTIDELSPDNWGIGGKSVRELRG
ncbi:MAG: tautomerase family protein [Thermoplasmatota archaeon]